MLSESYFLRVIIFIHLQYKYSLTCFNSENRAIRDMEMNKIILQIEKMIEKYGIPFYLNRWKKPKVPADFKDYDDFLAFVNRFAGSYHKHTFVESTRLSKSQNRIAQKTRRQNDRKMPRFAFNGGIGRITFFHFYRNNTPIDTDEKRMVGLVRGKIAEWKKLRLNGIIIDLRKHYGGDMYPALKSLVDILGNNITLLSFDNVKTKPADKKWVNIRDGEIKWDEKFIGDKLAATFPIAIIISKHTISSGEFVAAAFYGKENVKIFGENTNRTGGYLSANMTRKINADLNIALTEKLTTTTDGTFHVKEYLPAKKSVHPIADAARWIRRCSYPSRLRN